MPRPTLRQFFAAAALTDRGVGFSVARGAPSRHVEHGIHSGATAVDDPASLEASLSTRLASEDLVAAALLEPQHADDPPTAVPHVAAFQ